MNEVVGWINALFVAPYTNSPTLDTSIGGTRVIVVLHSKSTLKYSFTLAVHGPYSLSETQRKQIFDFICYCETLSQELPQDLSLLALYQKNKTLYANFNPASSNAVPAITHKLIAHSSLCTLAYLNAQEPVPLHFATALVNLSLATLSLETLTADSKFPSPIQYTVSRAAIHLPNLDIQFLIHQLESTQDYSLDQAQDGTLTLINHKQIEIQKQLDNDVLLLENDHNFSQSQISIPPASKKRKFSPASPEPFPSTPVFSNDLDDLDNFFQQNNQIVITQNPPTQPSQKIPNTYGPSSGVSSFFGKTTATTTNSQTQQISMIKLDYFSQSSTKIPSSSRFRRDVTPPLYLRAAATSGGKKYSPSIRTGTPRKRDTTPPLGLVNRVIGKTPTPKRPALQKKLPLKTITPPTKVIKTPTTHVQNIKPAKPSPIIVPSSPNPTDEYVADSMMMEIDEKEVILSSPTLPSSQFAEEVDEIDDDQVEEYKGSPDLGCMIDDHKEKLSQPLIPSSASNDNGKPALKIPLTNLSQVRSYTTINILAIVQSVAPVRQIKSITLVTIMLGDATLSYFPLNLWGRQVELSVGDVCLFTGVRVKEWEGFLTGNSGKGFRIDCLYRIFGGRDITDIDMKKILVGEFEEELKGLFRWSEGCSVFLALKQQMKLPKPKPKNDIPNEKPNNIIRQFTSINDIDLKTNGIVRLKTKITSFLFPTLNRLQIPNHQLTLLHISLLTSVFCIPCVASVKPDANNIYKCSGKSRDGCGGSWNAQRLEWRFVPIQFLVGDTVLSVKDGIIELLIREWTGIGVELVGNLTGTGGLRVVQRLNEFFNGFVQGDVELLCAYECKVDGLGWIEKQVFNVLEVKKL